MPLLACDNCKTLLPGAVVNRGEMLACPGCSSPLSADVFPAFFRPQAAGTRAEALGSDEDAGCFYHPAKKAVVPCGRCGRFLCTLCDIDLGSARHVCPGCLEAARLEPHKSGGSAVDLPVQRQVMHDQIALLLTVLPLFIFSPILMVTAPVALFLVVRYWNEPRRAVLPRSRARLLIAGFFALSEIGVGIILVIFLLNRNAHAFG